MGNELQRADKSVSGILKSLTMNNTDRANAANRSVTEYRPCAVEAFFPPDRGVYNALVSGGDRQVRVEALLAEAASAVSNGFPVIVLHEGNSELQEQLRNTFSAGGRYLEVSRRTPCFEPFYGLSAAEIADQVLKTAPASYTLNVNVRYYIDAVGEILKKSGKHLSFRMYRTCPHAQLFDRAEDLRLAGALTDSEFQAIQSKLMIGQSECYKLETCLADLEREMEPVMYRPKQGQRPVNILSALQKDAVLCVDLLSAANEIYLNTLICQLKAALRKGLQYTILIDSIPVHANAAYEDYLKAPSDQICRMIASEDLYAMTGGDENLFAALVGASQITIVMNHRSGKSAEKWAEVFGQYDKYEKSYSNSRGSMKRTPFSLFSSPNRQSTVNINKNREYIVKPEAIARMCRGEAYILTAARGELAHLVLSPG